MEHMLAIVTISGKQYKVSTGDRIEVDKIEGKVGDAVQFDHVLLTNDKGATKIGTPLVGGVKVKAKIVAQGKGEKIEVRRYKSKVRYRRHIGFRPSITQIEITAIV
jgi:large subunit ribosomal protein L21